MRAAVITAHVGVCSDDIISVSKVRPHLVGVGSSCHDGMFERLDAKEVSRVAAPEVGRYSTVRDDRSHRSVWRVQPQMFDAAITS